MNKTKIRMERLRRREKLQKNETLLRYTRKQEEIVAKRVGYKIDHILPKELYRVAALLPIYIGDKPISPRFQKQQETYISTFATQMALIGFNDIPDNKER